MSRWIWLGGLMLMFGNTQAEACVARFSFTFGSATSGSMGANSGQPCAAQAERTGSKTVIRKVTVIAPPRNGTASAGGHGVTYRSKPGYKGDDAFTFTIFGDGNAGTNTTATVQMAVTVK